MFSFRQRIGVKKLCFRLYCWMSARWNNLAKKSKGGAPPESDPPFLSLHRIANIARRRHPMNYYAARPMYIVPLWPAVGLLWRTTVSLYNWCEAATRERAANTPASILPNCAETAAAAATALAAAAAAAGNEHHASLASHHSPLSLFSYSSSSSSSASSASDCIHYPSLHPFRVQSTFTPSNVR